MTVVTQLDAKNKQPTETIYSNAEARKILHFLLGNVQTAISPELLPNDETRYPQLGSILEHNPPDPGILLDKMVASGVLVAELVDKAPSCPECSSKEVSTRYLCPQCYGYDVARGYLYEHLKCGKVGGDESFKKEDGLICPKCQAVLHNFGVEYRAVGAWYRCNSCNNSFNAPTLSHFCRPNHHEFSPDRATLVPIYEYRLNAKALPEIRREVLLYSEAITMLENSGLTVTAPQSLPGKSGQARLFDIVVTFPKKGFRGSKIVTIDVVLSDAPAGVQVVKEFAAKVKDAGISESYLIATPGLSEEARVLAKNSHLAYVEGMSLKEAMESLRKQSAFERLLARL
jgi:transposase-like protein